MARGTELGARGQGQPTWGLVVEPSHLHRVGGVSQKRVLQANRLLILGRRGVCSLPGEARGASVVKTWSTGSPHGHSCLLTTPPHPGTSGRAPGAERCQHERTQGGQGWGRGAAGVEWPEGGSSAGGKDVIEAGVPPDRRQVTTGQWPLSLRLPQRRQQKPPGKNMQRHINTQTLRGTGSPLPGSQGIRVMPRAAGEGQERP